MANTKKLQFFFGLTLIILGSCAFVFASAKSVYPLNFGQKTQNIQQEIAAKPTKIYIPKLQRVLYISDGYQQENSWTISQTGVSFLTSSTIPGSQGNTVIYGHNTKDILGGLWRVQNGDVVYVVMEDGNFYKYQVFATKEITPNQVEILQKTQDNRLTIYTCSGTLDTARFVVTALETS